MGAPEGSGPLVRLVGAGLLIAVAGFVLAVLGAVAQPPAAVEAPDAGPSLDAAFALPTLERPVTPPVQAGPRGVPPDVEATADVRAAPWAPGLRLHETDLEGPWESRRAVIEDLTTKDRRSYAIGDLLPHGSLLVGISTGAAQVLVADVELIELRKNGKLRSLNDFRTAYEARPLSRAPALSDDYVEGAARALETTLSEDPEEVQAAIDAMIAAGEPALELVLPAVGSLDPVVPGAYRFPSPDGPVRRPAVQGDVVVGVLEAVTGQSFGDVFSPGVTDAERAEVARGWRRWWGLE